VAKVAVVKVTLCEHFLEMVLLELPTLAVEAVAVIALRAVEEVVTLVVRES
jgi:hypothetical protein